MSKIYREIAHLSQATGAWLWLAHMSDAYCSLESWGRGGGATLYQGVEREGVNSLAWSGNIWCCDVILWGGGGRVLYVQGPLFWRMGQGFEKA